MPSRYRRTRRPTRRPVTRRKKIQKKNRIPRAAPLYRYAGNPFPDTMVTRHSYTTRFKLDQSTVTLPDFVHHDFVINSLFRPEKTGTPAPTDNAMGFVEMSTIYHFFEVLGAKMHATFMMSTATEGSLNNVIVGIAQNDDSAYCGNDLERLLENGNVAYRCMTDINDKVVIKKNYSQRKTFGPHIRGNSAQKGTELTGPSPSSEAHFGVFACATDSALAAPPLDVLVRISFVAKWSKRADVTRS